MPAAREAVPTQALGSQRRVVLRGQAVVTLKERLHPVRRQVVFRVQALGGMAVAADVGRDLEGRSGFKPCDLVLGMAVGAGGRVAVAGGDRFAVNTFFNVLGFLLVAGATGLSQSREMKGRLRRRGRQNGVAVVAIAARVRIEFAP